MSLYDNCTIFAVQRRSKSYGLELVQTLVGKGNYRKINPIRGKECWNAQEQSQTNLLYDVCNRCAARIGRVWEYVVRIGRQEENATVFYDEKVTDKNVNIKETVETNMQETETVFETGKQDAEMEVQNAAAYGNPKEVLDNIVIVSNVEVIKSETDELKMNF